MMKEASSGWEPSHGGHAGMTPLTEDKHLCRIAPGSSAISPGEVGLATRTSFWCICVHVGGCPGAQGHLCCGRRETGQGLISTVFVSSCARKKLWCRGRRAQPGAGAGCSGHLGPLPSNCSLSPATASLPSGGPPRGPGGTGGPWQGSSGPQLCPSQSPRGACHLLGIGPQGHTLLRRDGLTGLKVRPMGWILGSALPDWTGAPTRGATG